MKLPVYLDAHATTPVDPRVLEAMLPYFREDFGNAASRNHAYGWRARDAVQKAREHVAAAVGANVREIVFTSGATESNNLAIRGVAERRDRRGDHVVSVVTEHRAVLDPMKRLGKLGFEVTLLPVPPSGVLDPERVRAALTERTALLSVMAANNEIGVLHPIREIGAIANAAGVPFHVDASQAVGKVAVDVDADGIDLLSFTAHKIYGPKGVGALFVRRRGRRVELTPQMDGGGHERGLRSGTLNTAGIVGFGAACRIAVEEREAEATRLGALRDRLLARLESELDGVAVNGDLERRLPHNLNVSFAGVDGESLLMGLDRIAVSSGSACTSAEPEPSHVLRALGVADKLAHASLRFGLLRTTTEEETDFAAECVVERVRRLRALAV